MGTRKLLEWNWRRPRSPSHIYSDAVAWQRAARRKSVAIEISETPQVAKSLHKVARSLHIVARSLHKVADVARAIGDFCDKSSVAQKPAIIGSSSRLSQMFCDLR